VAFDAFDRQNLATELGQTDRVRLQLGGDDVRGGQRHHVAAEQKTRPLRIPAGAFVRVHDAHRIEWVIGHIWGYLRRSRASLAAIAARLLHRLDQAQRKCTENARGRC